MMHGPSLRLLKGTCVATTDAAPSVAFSLTRCYFDFILRSLQSLFKPCRLGSGGFLERNQSHSTVTETAKGLGLTPVVATVIETAKGIFGCPRSSFNDVTSCDCQNCRISWPYRDAQDRLLWRDRLVLHVPSWRPFQLLPLPLSLSLSLSLFIKGIFEQIRAISPEHC